MLASEINHPLPQAVLTADKKMCTYRNKEDTSIERKCISPWQFPRQKNCCPAPFSCWRLSRASGQCDREL